MEGQMLCNERKTSRRTRFDAMSEGRVEGQM